MVADDMPKSELGSYGAAGDLTPRLDALARDAVRFDAAHSPSPLCTPARYSLLTGRHAGCAFAPSTRRVRQLSLNGTMRELPELANIEFNVNLPALATKPAHATVAQLLAQHGIPSGLVGKWHLGYPPSTVNSSERTFVQSARMPRQWNAVKPLVLREYKSLQAHVRAAGFAFVERLYVNNLYPEQHVLPAEMLRHNVEWIAEGAAKFVESHRGAPYFLYVGWTLPHNPDVGESIDADVRYTPGGMWAANRSLVRAQRDAVKRRTAGLPDTPRMGHAHYPLALAWLDAGVGLVLDALERNALVAFTADHHSYDKRHCYTHGSQVPLIVRWPEHVPPRAAAVAALVLGAPAARRRHGESDDSEQGRRNLRRRFMEQGPKARLRVPAMLLRVGDSQASRVVSARRHRRDRRQPAVGGVRPSVARKQQRGVRAACGRSIRGRGVRRRAPHVVVGGLRLGLPREEQLPDPGRRRLLGPRGGARAGGRS